MNVTKYEHACLVLEELGQHLVIDPGMFTVTLPNDLKNVTAVVVTHQHSDHLDKGNLQTIVSNNPGVTIFAPQDVLDQLSDIEAKKELAQPGVSHTAGSFALDFHGNDHAIIYETVPCQNVGVMVNKTLYYPGDSFVEPGVEVKLLGIPTSAPWLKVGEAMEFMKKVLPGAAFPTHNALYNDIGAMSSNTWLEKQAATFGIAWKVLQPGDSVEV